MHVSYKATKYSDFRENENIFRSGQIDCAIIKS
jgi:hypothetical protein